MGCEANSNAVADDLEELQRAATMAAAVDDSKPLPPPPRRERHQGQQQHQQQHRDENNDNSNSSNHNDASDADHTDADHAKGRQVAELAAAAAHRKSLDEDQVLAGGTHNKSPSTASSSAARRQVTRHRSSGLGRNLSSSGGAAGSLRAMSRSLGPADAPGGPSRLLRTSSMHSPRSSRGVHRSKSSDMSPMLTSRSSFARSGAGFHAGNTTPGELHNFSSSSSSPERGVRRSQSSITGSGARAAPERRGMISRSDSARGVPSRRGVGRTCSQDSLNHMSQNGTGASAAKVGSLQPYRGREGALGGSSSGANVSRSVQRTNSLTSDRARNSQLSMLRRSLTVENDNRSVGEMSNFTMATMDSVNLRKQQIVADPIDDADTYRADEVSVADHESVSMSVATNDVLGHRYTEFPPEQRSADHIPYDGVSVADTIASEVDSTSPGGGLSPHHLLGPNNERGPIQYPQRLLDTRYMESDTNHSRPNQIACDAVSLSTMGEGNYDEEQYDEGSYLDDYESTLREEIEAFEEADDDDDGLDELHLLEGVKEREDEGEEDSKYSGN